MKTLALIRKISGSGDLRRNKKVVKALTDEVRDAILRHESVGLMNVGVFSVRKVKTKKAWDIKKKKQIIVAPSVKIHYKPSLKLRSQLRANFNKGVAENA